MMFPGKFAFESGSLTAIRAPPGLSDWEKSPARSRAVGRVWNVGVDPADLLGLLSKLKKKNSFWRLVLNSLGTEIGPPIATPLVLNRYSDFARPLRLLKKLLALNISWRL